jgi:excisionase family DNA binding protein
MTETDEVDVTCPRCKHAFTVEVEAAEPTPPTPNTSEKFYKLSEVAKRLDIGRSTLKKWIYEKKIKAVKFGTGGGSDPWRIADSEIARFTAGR